MNKHNYIINQYNIFVDIDAKKLKYNGTVIIDINTIVEIPSISINSSDLEVLKIKINSQIINNWKENKSEEIIQINYNFSVGKYKLEIEFKNLIKKEMDGLYYCEKNNGIILCTHFEPIGARKFIPCFDEPNLKAVFVLNVLIDKEYNIISNGSVKEINYSNKNILKKKISFNATPKMSTYLLCLVGGNIDPVLYIPLLSNDGVKINGYSILSETNKMLWSLEHTKKSLDFFTKWFGINYKLDKLDIVSIPNFSSGAMENWGLITFREEYILLYDEKNYLSKIKILEVIYHEIAHQWFGNLVTMDNWNGLWLNESTATYFSWMALEIMYPDYLVKELYWLLECKNVLITDAMTNTHPIVIEQSNINNKKNHSTNIVDPIDLFDEITYSKGNCIIRYISNLLGINNFRKSINKYLESNLFSNTTSTELYKWFNEFSLNKQIDYVELMNNLVKTKGYPILYISKENDNFFIEIKKFNLDKTQELDYSHDIWIKINYFNSDIDIDIDIDKKNTNNDVNIKMEIIKLKPNIKNLIPKYITNNKFTINPNNTLFCICIYNFFIPHLEIMNQVEIMKYINDNNILCLYNYISLSDYLNLILVVCSVVNIKENYLLLYQIILDLGKIFEIFKLSCKIDTRLLNFVKSNLKNKWIDVFAIIGETKPKYYQMVCDKILSTELICLESTELNNLYFQTYLIMLKYKNYHECYFEKTLFLYVVKFHQNEQINNLIMIMTTTSNPITISKIIESFSLLNDNNFELVFNKYNHIIKSQDYELFFWSVSKIYSKQDFLIDYWINNREQITHVQKNQFKILKKISLNIYNVNLIDKIIKYINSIYFDKHKLILDKILDILKNNKIICNNLKY